MPTAIMSQPSTNRLATDRLRTMLSLPATVYSTGAGLDQLDHLMCEVVEEMKQNGLAPEQVLLSVKGIALEAGLGPASASLMDRLVTRCVEQYFKGATPKETTENH